MPEIPIQHTRGYQILVEGLPTAVTSDPLVLFLYLLMRDHARVADVTQIAADVCGNPDAILSNGYLAQFAEHLAFKLRQKTPNVEKATDTESTPNDFRRRLAERRDRHDGTDTASKEHGPDSDHEPSGTP